MRTIFVWSFLILLCSCKSLKPTPPDLPSNGDEGKEGEKIFNVLVRVYDSDINREDLSVVGARVTLGSHTQLTNANGLSQFALEAGSYLLKVENDNFDSLFLQIEVKSNVDQRVAIHRNCQKLPENKFAACYFDNLDFTALRVNSETSSINFDWGDGSPAPQISADTFSARFQGNFNFEEKQYDFAATGDDGYRVWIDDELIIDHWSDHGPETRKALRAMTAGKHRVVMEYYENGGGALAKLEWSGYRGPEPRRGLVRLNGRTLVDDTGEFNALGATLFSAARWYRSDRAHLERQLQTLKDNGFEYIRALGTVAWQGKEIDPKWPDYRQVIEGVTDLAFDKYGIRVQWTIFGDAQIIAPTYSERKRIVEMFLDISRSRQEKIIMFEIANEHFKNGFDGDQGIAQLREFAAFLNANTPILVATSAGEDCTELNQDGVSDIGVVHFDRDISGEDGMWRPVRQPWEYSCGGIPGSNNEPIGPGSSVNCDSDPMRLAMAAVTTYNSGLPFYVFHTRVGVGQGNICGLNGDQDMEDMPGINAFKVMKEHMPLGSSGWTKNATTSPGNPFITTGCMRNYASTKDTAFIAGLINCPGTVNLQARWATNYEVIHPLTGEVLRQGTLTPGESFTLTGVEAYLIKGTVSGNQVIECNGAPIEILRCHRSRFGTPMSHENLNALLRGAARDFNRVGVEGGPFGILRKVNGNNCLGYSCDILCSGQGDKQRQWDVLISEDVPTWGSDIGPGIRVDVCEEQ